MSIRHAAFTKAVLALALLALPHLATAQTVRYLVVPLVLAPSQIDCVPTAINQAGEIVGYCNAGSLDSLAVVWRNGAAEPLGRLPNGVYSKAQAINSTGTIVGEGDTKDLIGKAIVQRNGQWLEIDGSGGSYQSAQAITDAGVIFGRFSSAGHPGIETEDPVFWVFDPDHDRYNRFDLPKAAGTPSTGFSGASVFAVSRFGIAAGGVSTDLVGNRAAVWMNDAASTLVVLATPSDRSSALAFAVSDDGRTAGWAFSGVQPPAPLVDRAVMWLNDAGRTLVDIGTLPGDAWSRAFGINSAGQVVGASYDLANVPRGFIFQNGALSELSALLDPSSAGWTIGETAGINNDGIIIATGRLNGEFHPVKLVPIEVPGDITPPIITLPARITAEATNSTGAVVLFDVSASDAIDGVVPVICNPLSGSTFALGTTTVNCTASDAAGNQATAAFAVMVQDTTGPVITVPSNITVEANGPVAVNFVVSAVDSVDGVVAVVCIPPSGALFPLGSTTVTCVAADARGNSATGSFVTLVQRPAGAADTTAPVLTLPATIRAKGTATGAVVTYTATAVDNVDGEVAVTCTPPSGSLFAKGKTTVNCAATDSSGNIAGGSFVVQVTGSGKT